MKPTFNFEILEQNANAIRLGIKREDQNLSFKEVFELWEGESEFIQFYKNALVGLNFEAFYWEHPAINLEGMDKRYECIIKKSPSLDQLPVNERAFQRYIHSDEMVTDFMNLRKDSRLVVPTKRTAEEIYNHFGKFIRFAEDQQVIAVFKRVGRTMREELEKGKLIWLNTAGLGVIWLHIRLDTDPRYYKTKGYKAPNFFDRIDEAKGESLL